jgi:hypothetical protein
VVCLAGTSAGAKLRWIRREPRCRRFSAQTSICYLTLTFRGDAEFDLATEMFEFLAGKLSTVRQVSFKDYTPEYPEPDMSDFADLEGRRAA